MVRQSAWAVNGWSAFHIQAIANHDLLSGRFDSHRRPWGLIDRQAKDIGPGVVADHIEIESRLDDLGQVDLGVERTRQPRTLDWERQGV